MLRPNPIAATVSINLAGDTYQTTAASCGG